MPMVAAMASVVIVTTSSIRVKPAGLKGSAAPSSVVPSLPPSFTRSLQRQPKDNQ